MIKNSKLEIKNSAEPKRACLISVSGDVHGVFFRHYTKKEAKSLGIVGWCCNEDNGSVKIFGQGTKESLDKFIEWVKIGSPMADVTSVDIKEAEHRTGMKGFEIR